VLVRIGSAVHRVARDVGFTFRALRRSHQVSPLDPFAFGMTALLLLGTALLASWLPARRAARTDPLEALTSE
jgi:ABC-type lipoprotein release transport system permease subunit